MTRDLEIPENVEKFHDDELADEVQDMAHHEEVDVQTDIQSREDAKEAADVIKTGRWYIAELDDPKLVVQSESRGDALEKIAKRWAEYTGDDGGSATEGAEDDR